MPTGWATIVSASDSTCLDVVGQSASNGSIVYTNTCNGGTSQAFQFMPVSSGFKVTEQNSNNQLDAAGGPNNLSDTTVNLYSFWGGSNEIWNTQITPDGYFTITVSNSGKCLTANATAATVSTCSGAPTQKWSIIPVSQ
jgi:hypothetical protein